MLACSVLYMVLNTVFLLIGTDCVEIPTIFQCVCQIWARDIPLHILHGLNVYCVCLLQGLLEPSKGLPEPYYGYLIIRTGG